MAKQDQPVPPGVNWSPHPEVPDTHGTLAKYTLRIPIFPRGGDQFVATVDLCDRKGHRMVGRGVPGAHDSEVQAVFAAVAVAMELVEEQVNREAKLKAMGWGEVTTGPGEPE